jgi:hypothetical protein
MMPTKRSLMRELRRLRWAVGLLCGLSWLLGGVSAHAQGIPAGWQPLGGPSGRISHLAASPDGADLYAASVATTHRAGDQTQWQNSGRAVRSDALYRSQDGGATWQPLTNDLPSALEMMGWTIRSSRPSDLRRQVAPRSVLCQSPL